MSRFPEWDAADFRKQYVGALGSATAQQIIRRQKCVACTTTIGQQYCYDGPDLFDHFRETTEDIARF